MSTREVSLTPTMEVLPPEYRGPVVTVHPELTPSPPGKQIVRGRHHKSDIHAGSVEVIHTDEGQYTGEAILHYADGSELYDRMLATAGGRSDMVGLTWRDQQDPEGYRRQITSCKTVENYQYHKLYRTTGTNRLTEVLEKRVTRVLPFGHHPTLSGGGGPGQQTGVHKQRLVHKQVQRRRISVFDKDNNLIQVYEYRDDQSFRSAFYRNASHRYGTAHGNLQVPRRIDMDSVEMQPVRDGIELRRDSPDGLGPEHIPVRSDRGGVSLRSIANQQVELELEGWVGLTWNDKHAGFQEQIVWQGLVMQKDSFGKEQAVVMFDVETRRLSDGAVMARTLRPILEVGKRLNAHEKYREEHPEAPRLNLHWEVMPSSVAERERWQEEMAHLGATALTSVTPPPGLMSPVPSHEPSGTETPMSRREALARLSNADLFDLTTAQGLEGLTTVMDRRNNEPLISARISKLIELEADVGHDRFDYIVDKLYRQYVADLYLLGIDLTIEDRSRSWIIQGLVDLHNRDSDPNPFADSTEGSALRRKFISNHLSKKFHKAAITSKDDATEEWRQGRTGPKRALKPLTRYSKNPSITDRLQPMLYQKEIIQLLDKRETSDDPALTSEEIHHFGWWIEMSFGRNF